MLIGFDLYSFHTCESCGYENFTPGIYVTGNGTIAPTVGIYRNSEAGTSAIAGATINAGKFAVLIGGVTGYKRAAILPIIYPSFALALTKETSFRIGYIPRVSGFTNSGVVHFSVERNF